MSGFTLLLTVLVLFLLRRIFSSHSRDTSVLVSGIWCLNRTVCILMYFIHLEQLEGLRV